MKNKHGIVVAFALAAFGCSDLPPRMSRPVRVEEGGAPAVEVPQEPMMPRSDALLMTFCAAAVAGVMGIGWYGAHKRAKNAEARKNEMKDALDVANVKNANLKRRLNAESFLAPVLRKKPQRPWMN